MKIGISLDINKARAQAEVQYDGVVDAAGEGVNQVAFQGAKVLGFLASKASQGANALAKKVAAATEEKPELTEAQRIQAVVDETYGTDEQSA